MDYQITRDCKISAKNVHIIITRLSVFVAVARASFFELNVIENYILCRR